MADKQADGPVLVSLKRRKQRGSRPIKLQPTLQQALEDLAAKEDYPLETLVAVLLCEALSHRLRQM